MSHYENVRIYQKMCFKTKLAILLGMGKLLTLPISQNGQTHSNNSSVVANELFECVWPFCGVSA